MIYEIRTYGIAPGSLAEVEKRYGEAYEYRKKYSALTAFLHTEIGPLNEIVHIWGYRDLAERARIRGEAAKDANWPPKIREFVRAMRSEIVVPFTFVPEDLRAHRADELPDLGRPVRVLRGLATDARA